MSKLIMSLLSRRHFLGHVALATFGLLTKDFLYPVSARANSEGLVKSSDILEKYHICVPYITALRGGKQTVPLRSGDNFEIKISPRTQENQEITIKGYGQDGKDMIVVFHTLYDQQLRVADQVYQEIDKHTEFFEQASKAKCKSVYEQVEDGQYIDNMISLDLLDYVISTSKLDSKIKERYQIASTNSRLIGIQESIESTLAKSKLTESDKKLLRGTYAYVRAGEPVPNFKALTDIDSIVTNSTLPLEIQRSYFLASAKSKALTVDFIIVKLINDSQQLNSEQKTLYLSIYQQVRDGKTVEDEANLKSLDLFIRNAKISKNAKIVYSIARINNLDNQEDFAKNVVGFVQDAQTFQEQLEDIKGQGFAIIPQATKILSTLGAEAGTGVSISSLSGAAATNATLAVLGGGSVAAGGLGMLGGLAVATGGAALIGAAGLLSIALVQEMDSEDRKNLGIAIGTGTIAGAATVLGAWTAASALGVAGTLSGAAAITTTISALGGLSILTGGAALVASGTAFLIWSLLQGQKQRDQSLLHQLETRTYTYTEDIISSNVGSFIQKDIGQKYSLANAFYAPNIPLDKLSNSLSKWLDIDSNEKVIALIDTSGWFGTYGAVFTESRLIWTNNLINYEDLVRFFKRETELALLLSDQNQMTKLSNLKEVVDILSDDNYKSDLSKLKKLVDILSNYPDIKPLLLDDRYRTQLTKLKDIIYIFSDDNYQRDLYKLKEVVDSLSDHENNLVIFLVIFLSPELVSLISDDNYKQYLSKLKDLIYTLSYQSIQDSLMQMLRELGQRYSYV